MKKRIAIIFMVIICLMNKLEASNVFSMHSKPRVHIINLESIILIDNAFYWGNQGAPNLYLTVNLQLINKTNRAIAYQSSNCSKFYFCNNKNMILTNQDCNKITSLVIPPQKSATIQLSFKFHQQPDTTFNFKIGLKLIKSSVKSISDKTFANTPVKWSAVYIFRTDKKHQMYGLTEMETKSIKLQEPLPDYYKLTKADRENYLLAIDQNRLKKPKDTILYKKKYTYILVPVNFINNSNEDLKYMSMSCSWLDYYQVNIKNIDIFSWNCNKNIPDLKTVAAHKSQVIFVPIIYNKAAVSKITRFKIGMSLQKYISKNQFGSDVYTYLLRPETSNLIWSNEIKIP